MSTEISIHAVHQGGMRVLVEDGHHQVLSDYPLPGGEPVAGLTSLQLLLGALASCSANGVGALLKRDGTPAASLEVRATGRRRETHPTILESIHLDFEITGPGLEREPLERTLELAETRICPVWVMVAAGTPITRSLKLN